MKMIALMLALGSAAADRCCDPRHDLLATGINRVQDCRLAGGVAVTTVVTDQSDHPFIQLVRCDFPIPLQREHQLPSAEQHATQGEREL